MIEGRVARPLRSLPIARLFAGSRLRRNVMSGMMVAAANTILTLISYPILLRYLGFELYGVWLVLSTVLTFAQLGNLGISQAVTKYTAQGIVEGDRAGIVAKCTTATALVSVLGLVVLAVVTVGHEFLANLFRLQAASATQVASLAPWIALLSWYVLVIQVDLGALAGAGRTDQSNYAQLLGKTVSLALSVALLSGGAGLAGLVIANAASYVVLHAYVTFQLRRAGFPRLFRLRSMNARSAKALLSFGGGVFGGSLLNMLFHPLNRLLVGTFSGVQALPVLEIGYAGAMQVCAVFETGIRAIMPEISSLAVSGAEGAARIRTVVRSAQRFVVVVATPAYAVIIGFAPALLALWLRSRCAPDQVSVLRVMLFGSLCSLLGVPTFYLALGVGRVRVALVSSILQFVGSVACSGVIIIWAGTLTPVYTAFAVSLGFALSSTFLLAVGRVAAPAVPRDSTTSEPRSASCSMAPR
jgi:O-antigen/teichoic acid export membrane protein